MKTKVSVVMVHNNVIIVPIFIASLALNEETCENEVAYVHLNVPWAQQAEKKSLNPGFLITIPSVQI